MHPRVLNFVLHREAIHIASSESNSSSGSSQQTVTMVPAVASGFHRFKISNRTYPGLVQRSGTESSSANGLVIRGLNTDDMGKLSCNLRLLAYLLFLMYISATTSIIKHPNINDHKASQR